VTAFSPLRPLCIALLVSISPLALYSTPLGSMPAHADDHDDDDDDDDDGGSSGGGGGGGSDDGLTGWPDFGRPRSTPTQRPQVAKPAPQVPLLAAARNEIVVLGLDVAPRGQLIEQGYTLLREGGDALLLEVPDGRTVEAALAEVATLAPEAIAAPNSYYRNQAGAECAADICQTWEQVNWEGAGSHACAVSPIIGVVDTGINLEHDMLRGADIVLTGYADEMADPSGARHGTAVAAMLVGRTDGRVPGLLPEAKLVVADPFATGSGGDERADAFSLHLALAAMIEAKVLVVNMSLAGPDNAVIAEVVRLAQAADVALVAAVGNAGPRAEPLYPAAYEGVLGVTAVDGGNEVYRRALQGEQVDLAAPGVNIATAASISGVRPQTGTSFATPFVTAAVAVARLAAPEETAGAIADLVAAESVDLGETGRDPVFGAGLVQVGAPC
jgi:hypothetical protein